MFGLQARYRLKRFGRQMLMAPPVVLLAFNLHSSHQRSTVELIRERGYLQVITLPGPITYYENAKGKTGFEYLLARRFADYLGVELKVTLMDNLNGVMIALGGPNGDFAAGSLTASPGRKKLMRFSQPYGSATQQLLYRLGSGRPKGLDELKSNGRLLVIRNSAHSERLQELKVEFPNLQWEEYTAADMLELMELVHNNAADYAVVDSIAYKVNRGIYPRARTALQISKPQPVAWAFPRYGDDSLIAAANAFLQEQKSSGKLDRLKRRFFGHSDAFSVAGSQLFIRRIETRLPRYEELFREVAEMFAIDWHLLAAIAYQESHWNARATSPTGVRGLMMLTQTTMREMRIKNRLDPEQSLYAGAQYFLKTKARIPADIAEPDRTWMALAAYNVGMGHLEDARVLTERHGKNPHLWEDVMEYLPLLEQKKYYKTVKYGFARGREPISYVQNIRHYRDILQWRSLEQLRRQRQEYSPETFDWEAGSRFQFF